jgi:predicted negative regulator of RcsB-dependent stress response
MKSKFLSAASAENRTGIILIIATVLVLATLIVYQQPLAKCQFINYDDPAYVTDNPHVQEGLTQASVRWAFTSVEVSNWHPITWISHMTDVHLFEMNPAAHHFSSLFFHILTAVVLFLLLHRMTGAVWKSALVAALFALHPQNVESVAWVAERKNILSTLFGLLTIWAYVTYVRKPSIRNYLEVLVVFALGLMTKPMLVTVPFVLLLLDFWPLERLEVSRFFSCKNDIRDRASTDAANAPTARSTGFLVLEKVPLIFASIASSLITLRAQIGAMTPSLSFGKRLANGVVSYAAYLYRTVWPIDLAILYPYDKHLSPFTITASAILLIGLTGIAILQLRLRPYIAVGWFWYLGTLAPVIGIVQVGAQANADRYVYVPLIGIFISISWVLGELVECVPRVRIAVIGAIVACLVAFGAMARAQVGYWQDSVTLFQHALNVTHNNVVAHINLGAALEEKRDRRGAEAQFFEALAENPTPSFKASIYLRLGKTKESDASYDEAEQYLKKSIEAGATYVSYLELGSLLSREGRLEEAERYFHSAINAADSEDKARDARLGLGIVLARAHRNEEAIAQYLEFLKLGQDASVLYMLGDSEEQVGHTSAAIDAYRSALQLEPEYVQARQRLESILPNVHAVNAPK